MTHLNELKWAGIRRSNLSPRVRELLLAWRTDILLEPVADSVYEPKYGLWLFGERRGGTSYAAKAVAGDLAFNHGLSAAMYVKARELMELIKGGWSLSTQVRANLDDMALWHEAQNTEGMLDLYFNAADVLLIDDLHHETTSMTMWKNHIQPRVEDRVKDGRVTIIATTMTPHDEALPKNVVSDLFCTIAIDGYRP